MKILYLTPWYPSERDAMSGLFVMKHVEALRAQHVDVRVIHSRGWADMWRQWGMLRREGWMPDLVQLNILQKQGALALWLKRTHRVPYILMEHWSGYLPENGQYMRQARHKRLWLERIAKEAECIATVSDTLREAMERCGIRNRRWERIDNVVDDFFFENPPKPLQKGKDMKTLLHVSCFDERAKNVSVLLRAVKTLSERRKDWRLVLVGTGVDYEKVRHYAESLGLANGLLEWTGELTPRDVCQRMQEADVLVMTSRYETAGVVLSEAAATGLPIISTAVGIAPELITSDSGVLVAKDITDEELCEVIDRFLDTPYPNAANRLRERAEVYRTEAVGEKMKKLYDSCMHRDI